MNYITAKLTPEDIEIIEDFTKRRVDKMKKSNHYKKRGGFKTSDITIGAAAEIGAYKALKAAGRDVSYPDFQIYKVRDKSYAPDLHDSEGHYMVKGQSLASAAQYSASWLFQQEDPFLKVPTPNTYVVVSVVDYEKRIVYIYGCIPLITLVKEDLFSETVLSWFGKTKMALYLRDITRELTAGERWSILNERGK